MSATKHAVLILNATDAWPVICYVSTAILRAPFLWLFPTFRLCSSAFLIGYILVGMLRYRRRTAWGGARSRAVLFVSWYGICAPLSSSSSSISLVLVSGSPMHRRSNGVWGTDGGHATLVPLRSRVRTDCSFHHQFVCISSAVFLRCISFLSTLSFAVDSSCYYCFQGFHRQCPKAPCRRLFPYLAAL